MIPPDLHVHTNFSCDCEADMETMCRAALSNGMREIGFTEHYDLIPEDPCYAFLDIGAWWDELERCWRVVKVRCAQHVEDQDDPRYSVEMHSE